MGGKEIYSDFGCAIVFCGGKFYIRYYSGEAAGSRLVESEITLDEFERTQCSEQDAYDVILIAEKREAPEIVA